MLSVWGRRQAGKSRLVTEFAARSGLPQLFLTGSRQASRHEDLARFTADVARESTLPGAPSFEGVSVSAWEPALRLVASAPVVLTGRTGSQRRQPQARLKVTIACALPRATLRRRFPSRAVPRPGIGVKSGPLRRCLSQMSGTSLDDKS
jgi:hypothetical protein